jgi:hypothetical protein
MFVSELSDVLDRVVTFSDPLFIVGDVNIHMERDGDLDTLQFVDVLNTHGLVCHDTPATHDCGGTIDIVASRSDLPAPSIDVINIGLSDHRLLQWSVEFTRPCPVYSSVTRRSWRQLDVEVFRAGLHSSLLCNPDAWPLKNVDDLAQLYVDQSINVLDQLIPSRTVACRRRPSDPWFDQDCRSAKRVVRKLERVARHADPLDAENATSAWYAARRSYIDLRRRKRESFWLEKVEHERASPAQLWRSVDALMGRGRLQMSDAVGPSDLHNYFDSKVTAVQAATADAQPPSYTPVPHGCNFSQFRPVSTGDVITAIRVLPDKQCLSDPLTTRLLKDNADVLSPFIVELFNRSLSSGTVPSTFKDAYITPLLKKASMDPADVRSYRPISNLSVMSKLLERLVAKQLVEYLTSSGLLPALQSAYRSNHSTETAVLKVLTDILRAIDTGNLAVLALLDLSAAFDTVDHATLLQRLKTSYGVDGTVLNWLSSYLSNRSQFVRCGSSKSTRRHITCGVPQGSVLGPILFLLYTADLQKLIEQHELQPHLYADDTQICGACSPSETVQCQNRLSACVDDVAAWMQSNRLQLNSAKTEVLWCSSSRRQHQIPQSGTRIGTDVVMPSAFVRDLGIYIDADVSMQTHVAKIVSGCFAILRHLRSIRRSVSKPVMQSLVVALVLTRLDYGNATLAGLPGKTLAKLQSVLNAAARMIFLSRKFDHVTPLLRELHWLRFPERIHYKLAVLAFKCLNGLAPPYLAREFHRVADTEGRQRLRSASTAKLIVPRVCRPTIGGRAFPVAAANIWNTLSPRVTSSSSLSVFKSRLKTDLFTRCYNAD